MGSKKRPKLIKGMPSAVVLSILIHGALFLLAGMLVVFTVVKKEEKKFVPPKAVERPKMKLRKPKVKVKKSAKPKPTTRIVTKVNRASMPNIQLPEMSGMTDGLAGGIEGFNLMPDFGEVSIMGSGHSIGNDFAGKFYDFKRDRSGRPIPYSLDAYRDIVRKFIKSGWKTSVLSRYYQSPNRLYATTFMIPPVLSSIAPSAFGEHTEGNYWMVHYKGQLVHKEGITFRFVASGDEILVVRVNGEIVMGVAWLSDESQILGDIWSSSSADSRKYWMGNNTAVIGDWITLEPGVPLDMEVIMADDGGQACLMLAVEEEGVEYERRVRGGPIFPVFKTAEPSHELLDAIYKNLVRGDVCLTNGPVFCDYDSRRGSAIPVSKGIAPPAAVPAEPDSILRTWTSMDGKTMEGELVTVIADKVVLKTAQGKQRKVPLAQLSAEDREYIELTRPPEFDISFGRQVNPVFSILEGSASGLTVAYDYRAKVKLEQKSTGSYNHELYVEFFAIGGEIHGDQYILLDRQKSHFMPSKENQRSHHFSGKSVELPNFTLDDIHRGIKESGYLVTVTDSRGKIIQHSASSKRLLKNLENLKNLPVGAYMDEYCIRVFPTGPKATRY
ncbi:MAG: hypothetical protein DRP64_16075 [Verrucomicrobia bacterium]|nr:MAG: hypothetical protein DRP64_16075 [Verrucomicrobiota bacterium]